MAKHSSSNCFAPYMSLILSFFLSETKSVSFEIRIYILSYARKKRKNNSDVDCCLPDSLMFSKFEDIQALHL